jgi:hypothetical protein
MATELHTGLLCALLLGACGCAAPRGLLFTYTTEPYTLPYETVARVGSKSCRVDITQLKEPVTRANLSAKWSNHVVGDAMRRAGMTEIRYADLQTLSIVNGAYERRRLIFYGE